MFPVPTFTLVHFSSMAMPNCSSSCYKFESVEQSVDLNYKKLLLNEKVADVIFSIHDRDTKEVKCFNGVSALFACHSSVFENMLFGSMEESQLSTDTNPPRRQVIIRDMSHDGFVFLKEYCYGTNPCLNAKIIACVLYAAEKYFINALKKACEAFILQFMFKGKRSSNIVDVHCILTSLFRYGMKDVCHRFLLKVIECGVVVHLLKDPFLEGLQHEVLLTIIQSDAISLTEENIWESCLSWSRKKAQSMFGFCVFGVYSFCGFNSFYTTMSVVDFCRGKHITRFV